MPDIVWFTIRVRVSVLVLWKLAGLAKFHRVRILPLVVIVCALPLLDVTLAVAKIAPPVIGFVEPVLI